MPLSQYDGDVPYDFLLQASMPLPEFDFLVVMLRYSSACEDVSTGQTSLSMTQPAERITEYTGWLGQCSRSLTAYPG